MIREAAVSAKIEMPGRPLAYPRANVYLDCEPSMPVDIATPTHPRRNGRNLSLPNHSWKMIYKATVKHEGHRILAAP